VDGASRGNPGPASYGVCIQDPQGHILKEISQVLGFNTNNFAEYCAVKRALEEAKKMGAQRLKVFTDSQLVANQVNGIYRIKEPSLLVLWKDIMALKKDFEKVEVRHILRSSHAGNKRADQLANIALDQR
jgi:ribonuclease HI